MKNKKLIRIKFRSEVFKRDGYCCRVCGNGPIKYNPEEVFDAHHITDRSEIPNGGYVKENGITLCKNTISLDSGVSDTKTHNESCHMKAEKFHISNGKKWEENMHPNDLYEIINSSKEIAIKKSKKL